jgi:hypothetical protein
MSKRREKRRRKEERRASKESLVLGERLPLIVETGNGPQRSQKKWDSFTDKKYELLERPEETTKVLVELLHKDREPRKPVEWESNPDEYLKDTVVADKTTVGLCPAFTRADPGKKCEEGSCLEPEVEAQTLVKTQDEGGSSFYLGPKTRLSEGLNQVNSHQQCAGSVVLPTGIPGKKEVRTRVGGHLPSATGVSKRSSRRCYPTTTTI